MFIAITAFEKADIVISQINNMYSENNTYLIHYNFRSFLKDPSSFFKIKKYFYDRKNIKIFTRYKVYWGHFSIIKSANNMMKKFIKKSNEDIFIHIDQKTINLDNILLIEDYIKDNLKKGYNFFNFNKFFLNKIDKDNHKGHLIVREKNPNIYTSKKFYKKTIPQNSKFYKIYFISHIIKDLIFHPKILWSSSYKKIFLNWKKYKYYFEETNISSILSTRYYKLPKLISHWEFSFYNNVGPFVILNKDEAKAISSYRKNINYKMVKKFYKYSKNKYLPEDFYFSTLYWNIISNDKKKSKNIMSYYDINSEDDAKYFYDNLYEENIYFIRRCMGQNNINYVNKYSKMKSWEY